MPTIIRSKREEDGRGERISVFPLTSPSVSYQVLGPLRGWRGETAGDRMEEVA